MFADLLFQIFKFFVAYLDVIRSKYFIEVMKTSGSVIIKKTFSDAFLSLKG